MTEKVWVVRGELLPGTLCELITWAQETLAKIPEEYRGLEYFDVYFESSDDPYPVVSVEYDRDPNL